MISRGLKLTAVGALFVLIGLSQSSLITTRRNDVVEQWEPKAEVEYMEDGTEIEYAEDGKEIEYITFEDIDAMMALEDFENLAGGEGGLRKLYDNTCWHGGQSNQRLWFGVRSLRSSVLSNIKLRESHVLTMHSSLSLITGKKVELQLSNDEPLLLRNVAYPHGLLLPSQMLSKQLWWILCYSC